MSKQNEGVKKKRLSSSRESVSLEADENDLNQKMLSVEEVTFNEIYFMTRKEIQQKIEIESSVKAKKIVDRRP